MIELVVEMYNKNFSEESCPLNLNILYSSA